MCNNLWLQILNSVYVCMYVCMCVCVCVCMYVYIYIYTHIHTHTHIYTHTYIHTHTHTHTHINIYVCTKMCMYTYTHTHTFPDITATCFSVPLRWYCCTTVLKSYLYCQRRSHVNSNIVQLQLILLSVFWYSVLPDCGLFQPKHVVSKFSYNINSWDLLFVITRGWVS